MFNFWTPQMPGWRKLGYTVLGSAATEMSITLNASPRWLFVMCYVSGYSGAGIVGFRFNGDTATNYGQSVSDSSAASTNTGSQTAIRIATTAVTTQRWIEAHIINVATTQKLVTGTACTATSGGTTNNMNHFAGVWNNTSNAITSITMQSSANNLNSGSEFVVYGRDIL